MLHHQKPKIRGLGYLRPPLPRQTAQVARAVARRAIQRRVCARAQAVQAPST